MWGSGYRYKRSEGVPSKSILTNLITVVLYSYWNPFKQNSTHMYLIIFILMALCILKSRPVIHRTCLPDGLYMTRTRTAMVNGFFIWLVFISHMSGYDYRLPLVDIVVFIRVAMLGQCIVASFFFYSGFGMMSSLCNKGKSYALTLLTRRFPMVLLHFFIAVLCFYVVGVLLGKEYEPHNVLLSLIGWESIGNSNWFIVVSLISYLIIALAASVVPGNRFWMAIPLTAVALIALIPVLMQKGGYWVDSYLCIPAGMCFYFVRPKVDAWLQTWRIPILIPSIFICLTGWVIYRYISVSGLECGGATMCKCLTYLIDNVGCILFVIGLTYAASCVSFKNQVSPFLVWSGGVALFYLYIFQRIPMLVCARYDWLCDYGFVYQLVCFLVTVSIAVLSLKVFPRLDAMIFPKLPGKQKNN